MGTTSIVDLTPDTQFQKAVGVYVHPEYERGNRNFDIALIQTEAFTINDYIRPVCTAPGTWESYMTSDVVCTTTGWGYTLNGGMLVIGNNNNRSPDVFCNDQND